MKTIYIKPKTQIIPVYHESLMLTASPGANGKYDPKYPIDSKENNLSYDEDEDSSEFDMSCEDYAKFNKLNLWSSDFEH